MSGIIKSVHLTNDDDGREVLRVTVDYLKGDGPDLKNRVIWYRIPVDIVEASAPTKPQVADGVAPARETTVVEPS